MKRFGYSMIVLSLMSIMSKSYAETDIPTPPPLNVPVPAQTDTSDTNTTKTPEARTWNLQDADILSIINEVSLETGKNFVVDPRVTGKISLISSKPIKPDEVYQVFLSVLSLLGYSAIQNGDIVKIVPNMESGEYATRVATSKMPGKGDEVIVRVIQLDNVSANQLIPVIRPMLPQWSNIAAYTPGNVVILLGRAENITRIVDVIHNIDSTSSNDIDVIPLHQAAASQLVTVLNNLQSSSRSSGDSPQVSIAADERSNSILLSGNKSARLHMKFLIHHLDTPSTGTLGNTQVVYLRYLKAKTFAPLLGKIAQNMVGKGSSASANDSNAGASNASNSAEPKSAKAAENTTNIQAEPNTNAVIITAPPAMMQALQAIVNKLDIRPAQVLVEGVIVEVDQDDLKNLGIQWGTLSNLTTGGATVGNPTVTSDFPLPGAGNIGIMPHTSISAILSILENKNGTNILSTPSISVLDNQKAILEIGQDVPMQTGSYATTGNTSTVNPFNTISTKPVTLKLIVIPQINLGNAVRLNINLKNDSLQNPESPGLTPIINTSNIQNSVIINSDDVLVLGGLISNSVTETINKVPLFGDIPVIGKMLFQQKNRKVTKQNLLVFIKPTILRNPTDAFNVTNTKYEMIRQTEINWPQDLIHTTPDKAPNVLPLLKNDPHIPKPFDNEE